MKNYASKIMLRKIGIHKPVKVKEKLQRFQTFIAFIYFTYDILAFGLDLYVLGVPLSEHLEYTQKLGNGLTK